MKVRPKLVLTFSIIFIIAFSTSSYIAHTTIQSSLVGSGLSDEQTGSILQTVGSSIGIASAIIGGGAILVVYWVSTQIANPIVKLSDKLSSQKLDQKLRNIEIKRNPIDKDDEISEVIYTINSMINRLNDLEEKKRNISFHDYTRIKDSCIYYHWIFKGSFEPQNDGPTKTGTNQNCRDGEKKCFSPRILDR